MTELKNFGIFRNFFLITIKAFHYNLFFFKSMVNKIKMINTLNTLGGRWWGDSKLLF